MENQRGNQGIQDLPPPLHNIILSHAATPQGVEPFSYVRSPHMAPPHKPTQKYLAKHGGQERKIAHDARDEIAAVRRRASSLSIPSSGVKMKSGGHGSSPLAQEFNAGDSGQQALSSSAPGATGLGIFMGGGSMGSGSMGGGSMGGGPVSRRPPHLQLAQAGLLSRVGSPGLPDSLPFAYNDVDVSCGTFQNALPSPSGAGAARNSLSGFTTLPGPRRVQSASSPLAYNDVYMGYDNREAVSSPIPVAIRRQQALTPAQAYAMSGGHGRSTAPLSQHPFSPRRFPSNDISFSAPLIQGPFQGEPVSQDEYPDYFEYDEFGENDLLHYDWPLDSVLMSEVNDAMDGINPLSPEEEALVENWNQKDFNELFANTWSTEQILKQQIERFNLDPPPASHLHKEKKEKVCGPPRVIHNLLPLNPVRPVSPARENEKKKETIEDVRSNMQKLLDLDRIQTDEDFAAMHYREGGVQFTRDACRAGHNNQWTQPSDPSYDYQPASPFQYSNESIFLNQRAQSRRYAEDHGEVAPAYATKERVIDKQGRVAEEENTKDQTKAEVREAAFAAYDAACECNLKEMTNGPKCVCNRKDRPWPADPPERKWMTRSEMSAPDGKEFWEDAMKML